MWSGSLKIKLHLLNTLLEFRVSSNGILLLLKDLQPQSKIENLKWNVDLNSSIP